MVNPAKVPAKSSNSFTEQSDEQRLCNEALASHQFDDITDEQWIALCERTAQGARHAGSEANSEG